MAKSNKPEQIVPSVIKAEEVRARKEEKIFIKAEKLGAMDEEQIFKQKFVWLQQAGEEYYRRADAKKKIALSALLDDLLRQLTRTGRIELALGCPDGYQMMPDGSCMPPKSTLQ
ncbi:MAG TPA: hypothetical protein VF648_20250 [Pyrinomonadaceae bacterium]|jgi:hypothetical protein